MLSDQKWTSTSLRTAMNMMLLRHCVRLTRQRRAPCQNDGSIKPRRASFSKDLQRLRNVNLTKTGRYSYYCNPFSRYLTKQLALAEDFSWYDPDCLKDFEQDIYETLSANTHLTEEFIYLTARQIEKNIATVNDFAAEHRSLI